MPSPLLLTGAAMGRLFDVTEGILDPDVWPPSRLLLSSRVLRTAGMLSYSIVGCWRSTGRDYSVLPLSLFPLDAMPMNF